MSRYKLLNDTVVVPGYSIDKTHWRSVAMIIGPKVDDSQGAGIVGVQLRASGYGVMLVPL